MFDQETGNAGRFADWNDGDNGFFIARIENNDDAHTDNPAEPVGTFGAGGFLFRHNTATNEITYATTNTSNSLTVRLPPGGGTPMSFAEADGGVDFLISVEPSGLDTRCLAFRNGALLNEDIDSRAGVGAAGSGNVLQVGARSSANQFKGVVGQLLFIRRPGTQADANLWSEYVRANNL